MDKGLSDPDPNLMDKGLSDPDLGLSDNSDLTVSKSPLRHASTNAIVVSIMCFRYACIIIS
jgi:hypothetical protein